MIELDSLSAGGVACIVAVIIMGFASCINCSNATILHRYIFMGAIAMLGIICFALSLILKARRKKNEKAR